MKDLTSIGVLEERAEGREKLYIHSKLLKLLTKETDDFEPYPDTEKAG